ncbi:MAG: NUDIX domain-containing protein [Candidatus Nanoarchaeia archaeon]|nr:NUDIX domain-containing protein [Candidatus Nanoarchaeia archaeon]
MRTRASVILVDKNKILLIYCFKNNKGYYVFPGGEVEKNETPQEAAVRELKEETNINVKLDNLFCYFEDNFHKGYYFLAKSFKKNKLRINGPESEVNPEEKVYKPVWIQLSKLKEITLFPEEIKEKVIKLYLVP